MRWPGGVSSYGDIHWHDSKKVKQMLEIAVFSTGTLLLLALSLIGMVVVAYVTYSFAGRIFQWLLLSIAALSVLNVYLSGRVLRFGKHGLEQLQEGGMGSTLVGKGLLLILVGIALSVIVAWGLWRLGNKRPPLRYSAFGIGELNRVTLSFVIYFIAFSLLPLAFAPRFDFQVSLVYPLFVWLALLLVIRTSTVDPVRVVRQALGLIVITSLVAAVLMPSLALQPGYTSLIPGFNMRLWGATVHANTLGSVATALLITQFIEKPRRAVAHHALTACTLVALILTQSKTAIIGALLGLATLFAWRIWRGSQEGASPSVTRIMVGSTLLIFLGAMLVAAAWLALSEPALLYALERRLDSRAVEGVTTLSNRLNIWDYAIQRGMESPWFGQGLSMWDLQTRIATGLAAAHAHNQYIQAFSRAGFVGLGALLVLLALITRLAWRARFITAAGSLALLVMFLVRSFTEVPLQPSSILVGEFFAFTALLTYSIDRGLRGNRTTSTTELGSTSRFCTGKQSASGCGALGLAPVSRR